MKDPDDSPIEVYQGAKRIVDLAKVRSVEPHGQRVYGEIPPPKVIIDRSGAYTRQLSRPRVHLATRRDEVYVIRRLLAHPGPMTIA